MADPIERYIQNNQKLVDGWLTAFYGRHIINLFSEKDPLEMFINSDYICGDQRRVHKLLEVLRYYDLLIESNYIRGDWRSRYNKDSYGLKINHDTFKKIAKKYAVRHKFEVKPPKEGQDRFSTYPTISSISAEGRIHIYFHQDQYEIVDRDEVTVGTWNRPAATSRKVRVLPKNLTTKSERAVFDKAVEDYYSNNMDEVVKLIGGFEPEVLRSPGRYDHEGTLDLSDPLRIMSIGACNMLFLDTIDKENLKVKLAYAKRLEAYAQAAIRDLEKLTKKISTSNGAFKRKLYKESEADLLLRAPMMVHSDDPTAKKVAEMILKGNTKGLI